MWEPGLREPDPIRISRPPKNEDERKELRAACKRNAQIAGFRGQALQRKTDRMVEDAIVESSRKVREPHGPGSSVLAPGRTPDGLQRTRGGILITPDSSRLVIPGR